MSDAGSTVVPADVPAAKFRAELPRVYALREALRNPGSPDAYFQDFDSSLSDYPVKRKHFRDLEADLTGLDAVAWEHLKGRAVPLFERRHPQRGWQAAFDLLNQVKAYNHLARLGATQISFIPESPVAVQKTPDIEALLAGEPILCEVKTINVSDDEALARADGTSRGVQGELPEAFFGKPRSSLQRAERQMTAFRPALRARKLAFVILNFDDNLHEYADRYSIQLYAFSARYGASGAEIVFDYKPAFYSASV